MRKDGIARAGSRGGIFSGRNRKDSFGATDCWNGAETSAISRSAVDLDIGQGYRVINREAHVLLEGIAEAALDGKRKEPHGTTGHRALADHR